MTLAIVTATLDLTRALDCVLSWLRQARTDVRLVVVQQGATDLSLALPRFTCVHAPEILGVVPAFALGVQKALEEGADIVACLHDDLLIEQDGWDLAVQQAFNHPTVGLVGFGGALGLGDADLYRKPYDPMQLARKDFVSNMRDAEAHGRRVTTTTRVSCLDGFSQIGRREFWLGQHRTRMEYHDSAGSGPYANLFSIMQELGVRHHWYDGALGCYATRLGWETWMLPIACHHFGGRTAVGDARYQEWARTQTPAGDAGFWEQAHKWGYGYFRDCLPLRVP